MVREASDSPLRKRVEWQFWQIFPSPEDLILFIMQHQYFFLLKFVNIKSNQEDLNYEKSHKQYQLKRLTKYSSSVFDIIGENLFIYLPNEYLESISLKWGCKI